MEIFALYLDFVEWHFVNWATPLNKYVHYGIPCNNCLGKNCCANAKTNGHETFWAKRKFYQSICTVASNFNVNRHDEASNV